MKKIISVGLFVIMAILFTVPGLAADADHLKTESVISPQFTYIMSMSAGLGIDSAGKATCSGSVTPYSNSNKSELTVSLQKYTRSGWSTIKSWSDTGVGLMGVIIEANYYVTRGTYRVRSVVKIYNSAGTLLETASIYSTERTY